MVQVSTVRRWVRYGGVGPVARMASGWVATRAIPTSIRRCTAPSIKDFTDLSGRLETSGESFVAALGWPAADVADVAGEFKEVAAQLDQRVATTELAFPTRWAVEATTGLVLYATVRLLKPRTVVETGVANGRSSSILLAALERNGGGLLHSFDIDPRVGGLVGSHPQWRLTICNRNEPELAFLDGLRQIGPIDFFFHDSDHQYLSQLFEYQQVWPLMPIGGVLASDDVDDSRAFVDFCRNVSQRPEFLFDNRKIIGAVRHH